MYLRRFFQVGVIVLTLTLPGWKVLAQQDAILTSVEYEFGKQITFTATLQSETAVDSALLFFEAQGDTRTEVRQAAVAAVSDKDFYISYEHPLTEFIPRTFARVDYRFEIRFVDGSVSKAANQFIYTDNRFAWQVLEEEPFQVNWYVGDEAFAQSILDVAQDGLNALQNLLPLSIPEIVQIYVYADSQTMLETLHPLSPNWVAAHADPDLGVVVVALPAGPEQYALIQQRVPHELMHVALYNTFERGYENIPTWLNEGLASNVELYPNLDFPMLLNSASERDNLLEMSTLCKTFPRDAFNAMLSYAQAASFTRYLYDSHGSQKLFELVNAYAEGVDCERGAEIALGSKLGALERQWRSDILGTNMGASAANNLAPWLVLLVAVLAAPLGLALSRLRARQTRRNKETSNG